MIEILKQHIDGVWNTSEYNYKNRKILIKSRKNKGMKAHAFKQNSDTEVDFTLRYIFITPELLLQKVKNKIENDLKTA